MIKPDKKESKAVVADIRNGRIEFIMESGKDYVKDSMSVDEAKDLLTRAKQSDKIEGYGLFVDNRYFKSKVKDNKKED